MIFYPCRGLTVGAQRDFKTGSLKTLWAGWIVQVVQWDPGAKLMWVLTSDWQGHRKSKFSVRQSGGEEQRKELLTSTRRGHFRALQIWHVQVKEGSVRWGGNGDCRGRGIQKSHDSRVPSLGRLEPHWHMPWLESGGESPYTGAWDPHHTVPKID